MGRANPKSSISKAPPGTESSSESLEEGFEDTDEDMELVEGTDEDMESTDEDFQPKKVVTRYRRRIVYEEVDICQDLNESKDESEESTDTPASSQDHAQDHHDEREEEIIVNMFGPLEAMVDRLSKMKAWSKSQKHEQEAATAVTKSLLEKISGGDVVRLLDSVLTKKQKKSLLLIMSQDVFLNLTPNETSMKRLRPSNKGTREQGAANNTQMTHKPSKQLSKRRKPGRNSPIKTKSNHEIIIDSETDGCFQGDPNHYKMMNERTPKSGKSRRGDSRSTATPIFCKDGESSSDELPFLVKKRKSSTQTRSQTKRGSNDISSDEEDQSLASKKKRAFRDLKNERVKSVARRQLIPEPQDNHLHNSDDSDENFQPAQKQKKRSSSGSKNFITDSDNSDKDVDEKQSSEEGKEDPYNEDEEYSSEEDEEDDSDSYDEDEDYSSEEDKDNEEVSLSDFDTTPISDDESESENSSERSENAVMAPPSPSVPMNPYLSQVDLSFEDMMTGMRRQDENTRKSTGTYHQTSHKPQLKSTKNVDKIISKYDSDVIYQKLIEGLKPYATNKGKGLSDIEIIKEFVTHSTQIDDDMSQSCVCGKEGLKYLNFMRNKNMKKFKATFDGTFIIGSECIKWFRKYNAPVRIFHVLTKAGTWSYFRKELKPGLLVFSIAGSMKEEMKSHLKELKRDYNIQILRKVKRGRTRQDQTSGVDILVHAPPTEASNLTVDEKYKLFVSVRYEQNLTENEKRGVKFHFLRVESPKTKPSFQSTEVTSVRELLK